MFDFLYTLIHGESYRDRYRREWREAQEKSNKEFQERMEHEERSIRDHATMVKRLEEKYLKPNSVIDKLNTENKDIIEKRIALIEEATSFIANANKKLEELGLDGYLKCYQQDKYFYVIAYIGGSYRDNYTKKCLRGTFTDNDDIKEIKDLYKDKDPEKLMENLAMLRPLIMLPTQNILDYYKFLPDFYKECLKNCGD